MNLDTQREKNSPVSVENSETSVGKNLRRFTQVVAFLAALASVPAVAEEKSLYDKLREELVADYLATKSSYLGAAMHLNDEVVPQIETLKKNGRCFSKQELFRKTSKDLREGMRFFNVNHLPKIKKWKGKGLPPETDTYLEYLGRIVVPTVVKDGINYIDCLDPQEKGKNA